MKKAPAMKISKDSGIKINDAIISFLFEGMIWVPL